MVVDVPKILPPDDGEEKQEKEEKPHRNLTPEVPAETKGSDEKGIYNQIYRSHLRVGGLKSVQRVVLSLLNPW